MRPIHRPCHVTVFHRVIVDVIHVALIIFLIAYQMLPEAPLPDAPFAFRCPASVAPFTRRQFARESDFDQHPTSRKILVVLRQCPDGVEMIRKHHHRINAERVPELHLADYRSQDIGVVHQQCPVPLGKIDGEEIACSGNPCAAVTHENNDFGFKFVFVGVRCAHPNLRATTSQRSISLIGLPIAVVVLIQLEVVILVDGFRYPLCR